MSPRLLARSGLTTLKLLVGSGDKIGLFTLPFLLVGLALNLALTSQRPHAPPAQGTWSTAMGTFVPDPPRRHPRPGGQAVGEQAPLADAHAMALGSAAVRHRPSMRKTVLALPG